MRRNLVVVFKFFEIFLNMRYHVRFFLQGVVLREHGRHLFSQSKRYLLTFNVFTSVPPSTDEYELRTQRISTRLFIFFLIVSMTILLLYTSLITVRKAINVEEPPLKRYLQLYSKYSQTLTCACTQISIHYEKFLRIEYTLHQVCSSIFVDQSWIDYLANPSEIIMYIIDFRMTSASAFQALSTFCLLINRTISDSFIEFYSRQYVSASVMSSKLFKSETESLTNRFKLSMTNSFLLSLSMIRDTTQANGLLSALKTNYNVYVADTGSVEMGYRIFNGCRCNSSSTCIESSSIYQYPNPDERLFNISGFYIGCYVLEALLQSTLECFYNQTCINHLKVYFPWSSAINFTALDSSSPSNYSQDSTIKDLVSNLMIEQWNVSMMYERYYNECRPKQCTYIKTRNDLIYIVIALFGIVGGLTTVLKLVVPRLVKVVRKKKEHRQPATGKTKSKMPRCMKFDFGVLRRNRLVFRWQCLAVCVCYLSIS